MRLKELLQRDKVYREPINNKRVIFLDELPWMDTARSDFKSAFDYFWNSWASAQEDLVLIACGSAMSWIITNLLTNKKESLRIGGIETNEFAWRSGGADKGTIYLKNRARYLN